MDGGGCDDKFAVFLTRLEPPLSYRISRGLVETHSQRLFDLDRMSMSFSINFDGKDDGAFEFRSPRFVGVPGLHLVSGMGCRLRL